MTTINTSNATQVTTVTLKPNSIKSDADTASSAAPLPAIESKPFLSDQAKILSSLYTSASDYLKTEHMEPFPGIVKGYIAPSGYINVEKYNAYLFDKAATTMVAAAMDKGIPLDKEEVLAQLKGDHSDIAAITLDDPHRKAKLGENSVFTDLTLSDLGNMTDVYITAKENGLDLEEVGGLALDRAIQNHYGETLQESDIYPSGWDFTETDPDKIAAAVNWLPESFTSGADEIRNKIQGDLGLGSDFIDFLLNPRLGLRGATDASLDFLSKLVDIYNKQKQA
ncbi:hypothetical protein [Pseudomonas sp. D1-1]|uniref:hypothetical protein n=1 Tax=Pseudomonas sp. D1-1 TaxID=1040793 RepID=UPI003DA86FF0